MSPRVGGKPFAAVCVLAAVCESAFTVVPVPRVFCRSCAFLWLIFTDLPLQAVRYPGAADSPAPPRAGRCLHLFPFPADYFSLRPAFPKNCRERMANQFAPSNQLR